MSAGVEFKLTVVAPDDRITGDNRLVCLDPPVKFSELEATMKEVLKTDNVKIWYVDENDNDDNIVISTQRELEIVIKRTASKTRVQLFVKDMSPQSECRGGAQGPISHDVSERKELALEGIRNLVGKIKDLPEDKIGEFRKLLNEVHTQLCGPVDILLYPLSQEKIREFLDIMINGKPVVFEFVPIISGDNILVPIDVITFINSSIDRTYHRIYHSSVVNNLGVPTTQNVLQRCGNVVTLDIRWFKECRSYDIAEQTTWATIPVGFRPLTCNLSQGKQWGTSSNDIQFYTDSGAIKNGNRILVRGWFDSYLHAVWITNDRIPEDKEQ